MKKKAIFIWNFLILLLTYRKRVKAERLEAIQAELKARKAEWDKEETERQTLLAKMRNTNRVPVGGVFEVTPEEKVLIAGWNDYRMKLAASAAYGPQGVMGCQGSLIGPQSMGCQGVVNGWTGVRINGSLLVDKPPAKKVQE